MILWVPSKLTQNTYILDTIPEPITPYDQHINEQQKEYSEMTTTNTLSELCNIITLDDIKTKANIDIMQSQAPTK